MKTTSLFAPGKVFLFGEWSVLEGAPALVAPVEAGQRGVLSYAPPREARPRFVYSAPALGMIQRVWEWSASQGWLPCEGTGEEGFDLVQEVLDEAHRRALVPMCDVALEVTPEGLFAEADAEGRRAKFGFGSSGSTCALLGQAILWMCGVRESQRARQFSIALNAHRRAQGGRGSGADVAVSVWGDLVVYRLEPAPGLGAWEVPQLHPHVRVEAPHEDVDVLAVWTGYEANTRSLMSAVQTFRDADMKGYGVQTRNLADAAMGGISAWRHGDANDVLDATRAAFDALDTLGHVAGVDVVTQAHRTLRARVVHMYGRDAALKPSGAGGGDVALIFARAGTIDRATWNAESTLPSWWICRGIESS